MRVTFSYTNKKVFLSNHVLYFKKHFRTGVTNETATSLVFISDYNQEYCNLFLEAISNLARDLQRYHELESLNGGGSSKTLGKRLTDSIIQ